MLTTVAAEGGFTHEQGSRECGCAWQIHRLLLCTVCHENNTMLLSLVHLAGQFPATWHCQGTFIQKGHECLP